MKHLLLFLILPYASLAQNLQIENSHYRHHFETDSARQQKHTAVKPALTYSATNTKPSKGTLPLKKFGQLYPILDIGLGYDTKTNGLVDLGAGFAIDINRPKFAISGKILPYYSQSNAVRDSIQNAFAIDPGAGRAIGDNFYLQGELIGAYRPNKFFTFMGGIGKNSFGDGYRSLLLSDNAAPNPFLKMETTFWTIKYVSLFNVWNDFYQAPNNKEQDITKLSAIHYLSWNISKKFNLSVFESVIWQARDSLTNRFFEPNYMNPFVLYRPVEYAQGSADNVLLGLSMSYKPNHKATIYTQFILDEFLLSEIRAANGWWANKFGLQVGAKSTSFIIPNLYAQIEYNLVRPFTYSHLQSPQAYGHANGSVTHPLGANFHEINGTLSYQLNNQRFTAQFAYAMFGTDTSSLNNGQNLFESYGNRDREFNHVIGQGVQQNVFSTNLFYEYPLKLIPHLYLTGRYRVRLSSAEGFFSQNQSFEIGIRSRIWNRYDDF